MTSATKLTVLRGAWQMAQDLWPLRWAAMREAGHTEVQSDQVARIQWETSGWLLDEKFLVVMAYVGVDAVGYVAVCQGIVMGLPDGKGMSVVGWYIRPEYRRGAVATRLGLAVARVARDMGISRLQGIVRSEAVAGMLEHHGFQAVGTVYEWEVTSGRKLRSETEQEVHRPTGGHPEGGAVGHASEPAIPGGAEVGGVPCGERTDVHP